MSIEKAIKVDGKKYFSIESPDGWSDPLQVQAIWSRTFIPEGKKVIQFDTEAEMITEIKKNKYTTFILSDESKAKFKKDDKLKDKIKK